MNVIENLRVQALAQLLDIDVENAADMFLNAFEIKENNQKKRIKKNEKYLRDNTFRMCYKK